MYSVSRYMHSEVTVRETTSGENNQLQLDVVKRPGKFPTGGNLRQHLTSQLSHNLSPMA